MNSLQKHNDTFTPYYKNNICYVDDVDTFVVVLFETSESAPPTHEIVWESGRV